MSIIKTSKSLCILFLFFSISSLCGASIPTVAAIVYKKAEQPLYTPTAEPFIFHLFDHLKNDISGMIQDPDCVDYMPFEADNLGTNDCLFTAFVNILLLEDLKKNDQIKTKAIDILSRICFMTIMFNEESSINVQKNKEGRLDLSCFKFSTLQLMLSYFNDKQIKDSGNNNITATLAEDGKLKYSSGNISEIIISFLKDKILVIERVAISEKQYSLFLSDKLFAIANRNGGGYAVQHRAVDQATYKSPKLMILTNRVNRDNPHFTFMDKIPVTNNTRGDRLEDRMEDHFAVGSLSSLEKMNPYYTEKKGLTLNQDFKSLFEEAKNRLQTKIQTSCKELGINSSMSLKGINPSTFTQYLLQF
ncbi:MAG: hypothetical protein KBD31_00160 [Proteobacteria bacterium]|nr:hypothetical protein [Pseudomonadota bacterium]